MLVAGTSRADITPGQGEDLCGFAARAGKGTAGVHDRLVSRWLYLGNEAGNALIGANDLIGISRNFYRTLRDGIAGETGIEPGRVCVATSHTHSGPAPVRLRFCGRMSPAYVRSLQSRMQSAAVEAPGTTVPVRVGIGASSARFAENRRDPAGGAVDRELIVVALNHAGTGRPVATVCNYACHPVVMGSGNLYVSADYPGYLQSGVEAATGAPCLFLNGACGDLNPVEAHEVDFAAAERMGTGLASVVLEAREGVTWIEGDATPRSRTVRVNLPVRIPQSAEELELRLRQVSAAFDLPPELFADRIASAKHRIENGTYPRHVTIEITLLSLGRDLAMVFIPGELFTEMGMRIKQMSPFRHTPVCGFSNGTVGYLPTRRAYEAGGYEPHLANFFYDFPEFDSSVEEVILERVEALFIDSGP